MLLRGSDYPWPRRIGRLLGIALLIMAVFFTSTVLKAAEDEVCTDIAAALPPHLIPGLTAHAQFTRDTCNVVEHRTAPSAQSSGTEP